MIKPRKQIYTLEMYLNKVREFDIRNDSDVQRQFVWSNEQVNELIVTVLTDDYVPPIILGEEDSSQLWIVDGGQRTAALKKYRYGNYRITSAVENSVIPYKSKVKDKNGRVVIDNEGNVVWEKAFFDIKNKTYEKLPDELKKRLNEYQIETVIHEHCDNHRISQLIKRYNNHTSMNTNQKAFTHIDNYARNIREILDKKFFNDYSEYTEAEKTKGVVERVVVETVMCSNHLSDWKKQTKAICTYLNQHAQKEEFDKLSDNLRRLEQVVTDDVKSIFNSKDSFLFLTLFDRFTKWEIEDRAFIGFLRKFKKYLRKSPFNGVLFDEIDLDKGTKDKAVIMAKLDMLENMLRGYLHMPEGGVIYSGIAKEGVKERVDEGVKERANKGVKERVDEGVKERANEGVKERVDEGVKEKMKEGVEERAKEGVKERADRGIAAASMKLSKSEKRPKQENFSLNVCTDYVGTMVCMKGRADNDITSEDIIKEYIDTKVEQEDVELFEIMANDISEAIEDIDSKLLSDQNRPSFVALVGYAVKMDVDCVLKEWFADYERREGHFDIADQRENFLHMKNDLHNYIDSKAVDGV